MLSTVELSKLLALATVTSKWTTAAQQGKPSLLTTRLEGEVAIIDVAEGFLIHDAAQTPFTKIMGFATTSTMVAAINQAAADPAAKAIVLEMTLRGGMFACCEPVMNAIHAARRQKPVYARGRKILGGAGYLIATAAQEISTDTDCRVGGLGVCMLVARKAKEPPGETPWQAVRAHPSILAPLLERAHAAGVQ